MDFVYKIDTLPGQTEADPLITPARLTRGRLVGGFLYFPHGPAGTLHFQARYGVHQILPSNPGHSYALNGCNVRLHLSIDFSEPPFELDFITWNTSTSHPHTLTVSLWLEPLLKRKWKLTDVISELNPVKGYRKP